MKSTPKEPAIGTPFAAEIKLNSYVRYIKNGETFTIGELPPDLMSQVLSRVIKNRKKEFFEEMVAEAQLMASELTVQAKKEVGEMWRILNSISTEEGDSNESEVPPEGDEDETSEDEPPQEENPQDETPQEENETEEETGNEPEEEPTPDENKENQDGLDSPTENEPETPQEEFENNEEEELEPEELESSKENNP